MYNPVSTYRIQFHKEFNLEKFESIISYLKDLGIATVYASPVFEATPGSTHGYDTLNPHKINPEIGSEHQLLEIARKLKLEGIGWLQDIVPNHMAFDTRNPWIKDVLEKGVRSRYASFFDIDWNSEVFDGRLMVPFLGAPLDQAVRDGELKIEFRDNRLVFAYYDSYYPLNIETYKTVLSKSGVSAGATLHKMESQLNDLESLADSVAYDDRWNEVVESLISDIKPGTINEALESINASEDDLLTIANNQHYRLVNWQETDQKINFRRFFTVNGLICLNIHKQEVFHYFHGFINSLVQQGVFDGLRVDHIDGLYDPVAYMDELRKLAGEQVYIIVEKILERREKFPAEWPVQGTSGYEFLAMVNNLLTNRNTENEFTLFYQHLTGDEQRMHEQVREKKSYILYHHMQGELENLYKLFMQLVTAESYAGMRTEDIKTVIGSFLIHCPVYRFYGNSLPFSELEEKNIREVFNSILATRPDLSAAVGLLEKVLLIQPVDNSTETNEAILHFYKRCMQFSGPLMAKGVEDTLMYTYNRFIAHNEVGDSTESFGYSVEEFHKLMKDRQTKWPLSMNATSTHDTKRGEDVRARLNVLSDMPKEWFGKVEEWREMTRSLNDQKPDANDEYFIYQTIFGSYPFGAADGSDYPIRLEEYLQKALREAKRHSNWTTPDEEYENKTKSFAISLLDKNKPFWKSFETFYQQVSDFAIINSLVQVILKFTCPGVPDVYQGTEMWDLSLVDPDNRRPVDFDARRSLLAELKNTSHDNKFFDNLWQARSDARIKLWLTHHLLQLRLAQKNLFAEGSYIPLKLKGRFKERVLAFARVSGDHALLVIVPTQIASISASQGVDVRNLNWKDTRIKLPSRFHGEFTNVLSGKNGKGGLELKVQDVFTDLPFAVLEMNLGEYERSAGILLHISSLPSPYGIGDLGPEARGFADFLSRSGQRYWQLLPVNPTEAGQGHSPYSAVSSRAGNILLISPDLLHYQGLLNENDLKENMLAPASTTDYENAEKIKKDLLQRAWRNFIDRNDDGMIKAFDRFCEAEKEWLEDFALYMLLKQVNGGKPWYEWEEQYKIRHEDAIARLSDKHKEQLSQIKWFQFVFRQQWDDLKQYCNAHGILLIGDLPFYISYDSSDVWSHRQLFSLDEHGNRIGVAGVPPDAFSDDGQLWGMPVFRWDVLKEQGYAWWVERLKNNRKLYDLVRLDHFRAFAAYWDVSAMEQTARNGEWRPGPGADFFQHIKEQLGELPFVAEDLGDIDESVLNLRDEFNMPGMKVLQFAFGEDFNDSDYIPHNYEHNFIAYTGTHDNNTTRGWYRTEADDQMKERIQRYVGARVEETEIASALSRLAMASVAKTVILPMQDVLNLDESARMNIPSVGENNWSWRLVPGQIDKEAENRLLEWTVLYNRKG